MGLEAWIILGAVVIGLAIVGVILVIRAIAKRIPKAKNDMDILKNRLAKGEISKEEYDELKKEFE